jgi:hypothetical protein
VRYPMCEGCVVRGGGARVSSGLWKLIVRQGHVIIIQMTDNKTRDK